MKKVYLLISIFLTAIVVNGQAVFRTNTGINNWNAATSWTLVSGTDADGIPDADDDVFIQSGHTITLTQNEACKNVNVSTGTTAANTGSESLLQLATFNLEVNGYIRCYFASIGTTPGTGTGSLGTGNIQITTGSSGKLRFVGNSRDITISSEWSAGNTGATTAFGVEIAMNAGQTATMNTSIKASTWIISNGILNTNQYRVAADIGAATGSNITINSGATVISSATGTGNNAVFGRTGSGIAGTLDLQGTLKLTGAAPTLGMTTITVGSGSVVEYAGGSQTLIALINSGVAFNTYENLIFSGTNTKTLSGNITVNTKLSMQGDATVALNLSTFGLTYGATATLEYKGNAAQTTASAEFAASGSNWPPNLIIDNTNGVTLHATRTLNGVLTLTNGKFTLGSNDFSLLNNSPTGAIAAYSSTSYVVTDGSGAFRRAVSSAGNYIFPVGSTTDLQEAAINFGSALGASNDLATRFLNGQPGTSGLPLSESGDNIPHTSLTGYWEIIPTSAFSDPYTGTFIAKNFSDIIDYSKLHLLKRANASSNWMLDGTHVSTAGSNTLATLQRTGMSGFSQFGIGGEHLVSLPVNFLTFSGYKSGSVNKLQWTTASEQNCLGFEIQRSTDGINFSSIGFVNTLAIGGNSTDKLSYSFNDNNVAGEKQYYRIRQVDIDNHGRLSNVILVKGAKPLIVSIDGIYPNPANNEINVLLAAPARDKATLIVTDLSGRVLLQQLVNVETGINSIPVNISRFASGTYLIKLAGQTSVESSGAKFIKQ